MSTSESFKDFEFDKQGRAYGHPIAISDEELVRVGPGTKGGELLRRYWQPFALAEEATSKPKHVKILSENLILFRDGDGEAGLLYPRCMHRGTNLIYGKVEQQGIRCCYHGWHFDVEGRCLDQPAEPAGSDYKDKVHQPWYPVREYHGLVFAYMGPPDKKPPFLKYSVLERPGSEYGAYRDHTRGEIASCN